MPLIKTKKNPDAYFMAERKLKWYTVAGSIYGTNINLIQIIGTFGAGYSIGLAHSHYEILAIPAIILLAYVFVPIYRSKKIFTLSEFLENRYNQYVRLIYVLLNISIIIILLEGAFYIGSRQLNFMFKSNSFEISYLQGIILLASVACFVVLFGGMESVAFSENIQAILMIISIFIIASVVFLQPEINGFWNLWQLDKFQPSNNQLIHLYLPTNHPLLPWSGVFSGMLILNTFFWTTNQFQAQRIMAAATNKDATLGTLVAGALKFTIPFTTLAAGIAASYIFKARHTEINIQPDDVFLNLINEIVPNGYGLKGIILAGLCAAILSSAYSFLNSASTMLSIDFYKRYFHKTATDKQIVLFGKLSVLVVCIICGTMAYSNYNTTYSQNSFFTLSENTSYFKPGVVIVFFMGIFWKKANAKAAVIVLLLSPLIGLLIGWIYFYLVPIHELKLLFGEKLNFFHKVFLSTIILSILMVVLSNYFEREEPSTKISTIVINIDSIKKRLGILLLILIPLVLLCFFFKEINIYVSFIAATLTSLCFTNYNGSKKGVYIFFRNSTDLIAAILAGSTVWFLFFFV
jgi:SSS family solute:Na+ symporter